MVSQQGCASASAGRHAASAAAAPLQVTCRPMHLHLHRIQNQWEVSTMPLHGGQASSSGPFWAGRPGGTHRPATAGRRQAHLCERLRGCFCRTALLPLHHPEVPALCQGPRARAAGSWPCGKKLAMRCRRHRCGRRCRAAQCRRADAPCCGAALSRRQVRCGAGSRPGGTQAVNAGRLASAVAATPCGLSGQAEHSGRAALQCADGALLCTAVQFTAQHGVAAPMQAPASR